MRATDMGEPPQGAAPRHEGGSCPIEVPAQGIGARMRVSGQYWPRPVRGVRRRKWDQLCNSDHAAEHLSGYGDHQRYWRLVANRAVRPNLVVVSTPSLNLGPGIVKAHEPVRVQALRPELTVEGLDKAVVGRLARPREVEHDALLIRP